MKVISTPQFSGNGEMLEPDVQIITFGGLWIPLNSHIVVMVLHLLEECINWKLKMKPDNRAYNPDTKAKNAVLRAFRKVVHRKVRHLQVMLQSNEMKVISTPQFSSYGEMVEPDVQIITSGGLWIPDNSHIVIMVLVVQEKVGKSHGTGVRKFSTGVVDEFE
ncbi:Uncharacterized protein Fot_11201 [Forsythia ovata]|uniref:Uncharacterized protein n=1 Tax=Forsythia ovata TaxID=205694 RepID=A0ABD1WJ16_9LAMI